MANKKRKRSSSGGARQDGGGNRNGGSGDGGPGSPPAKRKATGDAGTPVQESSRKRAKHAASTASIVSEAPVPATASTSTSSSSASASAEKKTESKAAAVQSRKATTAVVSSNWKALQETMKSKSRPKAPQTTEAPPPERGRKKRPLKTLPPPIKDDKSVTKIIALDCEMVGVGIRGKESMLARVCIVNSFGNVIYDKFVKPREDVVDYRTWVSGVTKEDLSGPNAYPFETVQQEVADLMKDRIVVGHGLENDFKALLLSHPFSLVRDTAKYRPLQRSKGKPRRLRYLIYKILGIKIQDKVEAHDPTEDARAALLIYKHLKRDWEEYMLKIQKKHQRKKKKMDKVKKKMAAKQAKKDKENEEKEAHNASSEGFSFSDLLDFDDADDLLDMDDDGSDNDDDGSSQEEDSD